MNGITSFVAATAARLMLCVLVLTASLGLCSACAMPESDVAAAHKCCSRKQDHKLPGSPVQKECRNSRLDSSLAETPEAASVVMYSAHDAANSVPTTCFALSNSWDQLAVSALAPIPDDPGSFYRILLL